MSVISTTDNKNEVAIELNNALNTAQNLEKKWLIGNNQINVADLPKQWHSVLTPLEHDPTKLNLYALILTQQQQLVTHYLSPSDDLEPTQDIPELAFASIGQSLRPLFNRVMAECKNNSHSILQLLNLLANYEVCAHPSDWMPTENTKNIPGCYFTWQYWANNQLTQWHLIRDLQFDKVNFTELSAAQIESSLTRLRDIKPQVAGQYIHQLAQAAPSEARYKLYKILKVNLTSQDIPILEICLKNKSKKVVQLATRFLSRLDIFIKDEKNEQLAQELAQWLVVKTQLLPKKMTVILPATLNSIKQQAMRTELINDVALPDLAEALGISLIELCKNWRFTEHREQDNISFIRNAFDSLPQYILERFFEKCCKELRYDRFFSAVLHGIESRFSVQGASEVLNYILEKEVLNLGFTYWSLLADQPLTHLTWLQLSQSIAWKELTDDIKQDISKGHYIEQYHIRPELLKLGLFLPPSLAQQAYDYFITLGVLPNDPALDSLNLNIALENTYTNITFIL